MKRYTISLLLLIYYLGLHNGQLTIWKDDSREPLRIFPYSAEVFPEADRKALAKGIPFSSQSDLTKLMEDYLS